jgi:hypothetical protein
VGGGLKKLENWDIRLNLALAMREFLSRYQFLDIWNIQMMATILA